MTGRGKRKGEEKKLKSKKPKCPII